MSQTDNKQTLAYTPLDPSTPLILEAGQTGELEGRAIPQATEPRSHELRVLLVDDHDDMLSMMNLLMSRRSYSVATANSGSKALQLMESFAPHIVVSDISMPDMDGYEMMEALRAGSQGTSFKSIALSGYGLEDDRQRAQAAGYDGHLTKPIDFDVLFELMDRLIAPTTPNSNNPAKPSVES